MDPEISKQLRDLTKQVNENNRMLRHMRAQTRWTSARKIIVYIIWIVIIVVAYRFVRPHVQNLQDTYQQLLNAVDQVQETGDAVKKGLNFDIGGLLGGITASGGDDEASPEESTADEE